MANLSPLAGSLAVVASLLMLAHKLPGGMAAQEPRGVPVLLLRSCTNDEAYERGDSRDVWVRLKTGGSVFINEDKTEPRNLLPRIEEIMASRMEKVIYLLGDDDIPYQRLAETGADLQTAIPELNILLPTSANVRDRFPCLVLEDPRGWRADEIWNRALTHSH